MPTHPTDNSEIEATTATMLLRNHGRIIYTFLP
jgi:hypothetical protein